jgi:hypothetical protein
MLHKTTSFLHFVYRIRFYFRFTSFLGGSAFFSGALPFFFSPSAYYGLISGKQCSKSPVAADGSEIRN